MTSTDDSDHGGPGPAPRRSSRPSPSSGFAPRFEPPRRERSYDDGANPRVAPASGPSARATWQGTSWEELAAHRRSVLDTIQAEADAAVAELEVRQSVSRMQRRQHRMSSRPPEAVDADYYVAEEREDDIEELCDILLEEYGVEVEKLPPGARAPIYRPTVKAAWPVTEEGAGRERERRSRMSRESRPELESSENEASEADDEELVNHMSRGPADGLRAQTSFRGAYGGYGRPFGGDWRTRRDPYDDSGYGAPRRPRPKPRGPGPGSPTGIEVVFPMGEDERRERKINLEREREMMRDREKMKEREIRIEREMRREELEREMSKRQKAENEEEWEDTHEQTVVRLRRSPYPPADPQYDYTHRPHNEYDLRRTESYGGPPTAPNLADEAGYRSGGDIRIRRSSEHPSRDPRPRSRPPQGSPDLYMHGGRHENDAPAPAPKEGESEDDGVRRRRSRERGNYRGFY